LRIEVRGENSGPADVMTSTAPPVSRAEREAYERWHAKLDVDVTLDTPWHRQIVHRIRADGHQLGRVLEIGCGRGGFATWLASEPSTTSVVAADFSAVGVQMGRAHARRLDPGPLDWAVADVQAVPFADGSFDTVCSCETIEHVPSPRRAVGELFRVLRPGGRLYLTCPNYLGAMGGYRVYLRLRGRRFTEDGQPINRFLLLPRTLIWLKRSGFDVEMFDSTGHYLPWPGAPPRDLGALSPRWAAKWFGLHSLVVAMRPRA
jgi:SAM-dependent methyltransferase